MTYDGPPERHDGPDLGRDGERLPAVDGPHVVDSLPGLARVAAGVALNTAGWGLRTSARGWRRVGRAATSRDEATVLLREVGSTVATVGGIARRLADGVPVGTALLQAGQELGGRLPDLPRPADRRPAEPVVSVQPLSLRERGEELLRRSRDVWSNDDRHPAYDRILDELAPDEARILVMLLKQGPQPSVDVRTGGPIGMVNSQLVAPGLNMVGPRAGVRHLDRVPAYLNNLFRLGLVWFSREPMRDHAEYQVLEAQPDVLEALHSVKFAKVVRRSIHLTPFGEGFTKVALVDAETAAGDLPEHADPGTVKASAPPKA